MVKKFIELVKPRIFSFIRSTSDVKEDLIETCYSSTLWDEKIECGRRMRFKVVEEKETFEVWIGDDEAFGVEI